jgi:hypothetical protein
MLLVKTCDRGPGWAPDPLGRRRRRRFYSYSMILYIIYSRDPLTRKSLG